VPGIGEPGAAVGGAVDNVVFLPPIVDFVGPKKRQKDPLNACHISKTFNHLSVLAHAMMKVVGFQAQANVVKTLELLWIP
jgi:hypothetical protein